MGWGGEGEGEEGDDGEEELHGEGVFGVEFFLGVGGGEWA